MNRRNILNGIQQTSKTLDFDQGINRLTNQLAENLTDSFERQVSVTQKKWDEARAKGWSNREETAPLDIVRNNIPFVLLEPEEKDTYQLSSDRSLNMNPVNNSTRMEEEKGGLNRYFELNDLMEKQVEVLNRYFELNAPMEEEKGDLNRYFEVNDPNRISKLKRVIQHDLRASFPKNNIQINEIGFNQVNNNLPIGSDKELSKIKTSLFVEELLCAKNYNIFVKNNDEASDGLFYKNYVWIWVKPTCEKEFSLASMLLISDSEIDLQETLAQHFKPL